MNKTSLILSVLSISLLGACSKQHDLTPTERQTAELGVRQFAGQNADMVGVAGLDSDNDGYVTGTLRDRKSGETSEVLCSYRDGAVGCRMKPAK